MTTPTLPPSHTITHTPQTHIHTHTCVRTHEGVPPLDKRFPSLHLCKELVFGFVVCQVHREILSVSGIVRVLGLCPCSLCKRVDCSQQIEAVFILKQFILDDTIWVVSICNVHVNIDWSMWLIDTRLRREQLPHGRIIQFEITGFPCFSRYVITLSEVLIWISQIVKLFSFLLLIQSISCLSEETTPSPLGSDTFLELIGVSVTRALLCYPDLPIVVNRIQSIRFHTVTKVVANRRATCWARGSSLENLGGKVESARILFCSRRECLFGGNCPRKLSEKESCLEKKVLIWDGSTKKFLVAQKQTLEDVHG